MKPEQKSIKNLTDRPKVNPNRNLLVYLFFLFISIILWYLNALSKEYTTVINIPVKYEQLPKGKVLVSDEPTTLQLNVKGFGFNILRYKLSSYLRPVSLPLSKFRLDILRSGKRYEYYLLTRYAKDIVAEQLGNEIQLNNISPDTLRFLFADVIEKKIPVKPSLNFQYAKQYIQRGKAIVSPDCILVSGPQIYIDTLKFLSTREIKETNVKDSILREVDLIPINKLSFSKSKVWVLVPVEKYTELTLNIPIEAINAPEGLNVKTFPATITLSCWVGLADYDKMTTSMFRATIDYNSLISNTSGKIRVTLTRKPSNAKNIRFYPRNVECLIEK